MYLFFRKVRSVFAHIISFNRSILFRIKFSFDRNVHVGKNCLVDPGVILRTSDDGKVFLGDGCYLGKGALIVARGGSINIGNNVHIGYGSIIVSQESITIGDDCLIAEYVVIRDQDHDYSSSPIRNAGFMVSPVNIGNDVWLGSKVTVLKGVDVGSGSVVGASSLVRSDIPALTIATGIPAKVIKKRTVNGSF